jgi:DNA-binding LacI/PurR family transcriptional regulator/NAD(P)-dependent dehydrogenase (short-subunit alcohol dehydrogenase family)
MDPVTENRRLAREKTIVGRRNGGPMYQQLRGDILARIRRGEFGPGDQLPSENQLCEQYAVSITTARRALLELVKEGVVQRKAGVGTTVAPRVRQARLAFLSIDYKGDAWRTTPSAMGELLAGIGEYAWQHDAAFSTTGIEEDRASSYLRRLVEERSVDGVLLRTANDIHEEYLDILEHAGLPYVVIKRDIPGRTLNCVISNDAAGARMATSHLLELGHKRVGFVCAKPNITLGRERLAGYREALREWGIAFDGALVRQEPYFTIERGYQAVKKLLEQPSPPSAIFVASDTMALGGYEAARELHLKIPDDVAFVGYDDIAPVSVLQPPLTTVRTSYYDFGRLATELLIDLIDHKEVVNRRRVIEPALIVRASTQPPDSGAAQPSRLQSEEPPLPSEKPAVASWGRLSGKVVLGLGLTGEEGRSIARAYEAEGARIVVAESPPEGPQGTHHEASRRHSELTSALRDHGEIDVVVYGFDLGGDLGASLRQALIDGQVAASWMSKRTPSCLLYVASMKACDPSYGKALEDAARAGLAQIVKTLATEWAAKGIRVNALLHKGDDTGFRTRKLKEDLEGPAVFLASDEAAALTGQLLVLGG